MAAAGKVSQQWEKESNILLVFRWFSLQNDGNSVHLRYEGVKEAG